LEYLKRQYISNKELLVRFIVIAEYLEFMTCSLQNPTESSSRREKEKETVIRGRYLDICPHES